MLDLIRWWGQLFDDWWSWKNPLHSIFGLICYQLLIYNFKVYFIPLYMIMIMLKNRFYSPTIDVVQYGIKTNKNVARLASKQEHEIYKRQFDLLEQLQKETDGAEEDNRSDAQPYSPDIGSTAIQNHTEDTLEEEEEKIAITSKLSLICGVFSNQLAIAVCDFACSMRKRQLLSISVQNKRA
ncbi:unnamed protein product [Dibothriocephalus latus]|uniref:Uncharacterized protein n=1 Tax=Dibothriocephalus latus TaxID=60516 RepID=A0A3P7LZT8_DIBLA|nr:unnamed protein product [Dibothriocephalus latus]